ncbi:MAG: hypothetical protein ACK4N5_06470, partial [Myxococcales bacterium]
MNHAEQTHAAVDAPPIAPELRVLTLLLERVAEASGRQLDAAENWIACERAVRECAGEDWSAAAVRAGDALRLSVRVLRRSALELLALAPEAFPLFSVTPSGETLELLGVERGQMRLRVDGGDPREVSPTELQAALGGEGRVALVVAESAAPLEALESHGEHHVSPTQRLLALMRTERRDIFIVVIYAVAVGLLALATPVAVQSLVNTVAFGSVVQPLVVLTILLIGCLVFAGVLRVMQTAVVEVLQQRLFVRVATDVAWRLSHARLDAFDRQHGPELV